MGMMLRRRAKVAVREDITEVDDLAKLTVKELIKYAATKQIDLGSARKKEDIINLILPIGVTE